MILLITNRQDLTADLVVLSLQERAADYVRFNTEDFPQRVRLTVDSQRDALGGRIETPKRCVRLSEIRAAWYRRPVPADIDPAVTDAAARYFATDECAAALGNLWSLLNCFWISPLAALRRAEQKLLQLQLARTLGLDVPETVVTSDPDEARAFAQVHPNLVVKPLGRGYVDQDGGARTLVFTERLSGPTLEADRVRFAPTLLQAEVPRGCDVRVTMVGRKMFAAEIHRSPRAAGPDWRRDNPQSLRHRHHDLPLDIREKLVSLIDALGLQFAAIDLILRPDNTYAFLEVNPNGQWGWLEIELGQPISKAVADLLCTYDG